MQVIPSSFAAESDCPICGWSADTVHTDIHRKRCQRWERACGELDYTPMTRSQAQEAAEEARDALESCEEPDKRFELVMSLTRSLFDTSLGLAISEGYHKEHPSLDAFRGMLDIPEIDEAVRERFPYEADHIARGATAWYAKGSRSHRFQMKQAANASY